MKITKRQLRRIIREAGVYYGSYGEPAGELADELIAVVESFSERMGLDLNDRTFRAIYGMALEDITRKTLL